MTAGMRIHALRLPEKPAPRARSRTCARTHLQLFNAQAGLLQAPLQHLELLPCVAVPALQQLHLQTGSQGQTVCGLAAAAPAHRQPGANSVRPWPPVLRCACFVVCVKTHCSCVRPWPPVLSVHALWSV